jgi:hypothetical protein
MDHKVKALLHASGLTRDPITHRYNIPKPLTPEEKKANIEKLKAHDALFGAPPGSSPEVIAQYRNQRLKDTQTSANRQDAVRKFQNEIHQQNMEVKKQMDVARQTLQNQLTDDNVANLPIFKAYAEMRYGEQMRKQILDVQLQALYAGYDTPEAYINAIAGGLSDEKGRPIRMPYITDAEKEVENEMRERESKITALDKLGHYSMVGALKIADIASEVLPYIMPTLGTALKLGWQAFAPPGSDYYTEGTIGEKFGNLAVNAAAEGVKRFMGRGRRGHLGKSLAKSPPHHPQ